MKNNYSRIAVSSIIVTLSIFIYDDVQKHQGWQIKRLETTAIDITVRRKWKVAYWKAIFSDIIWISQYSKVHHSNTSSKINNKKVIKNYPGDTRGIYGIYIYKNTNYTKYGIVSL